MLARRFTIACLLIAIFGALFSMLVTKSTRPARSWEIGTVVPCVFEQGAQCMPPRRR